MSHRGAIKLVLCPISLIWKPGGMGRKTFLKKRKPSKKTSCAKCYIDLSTDLLVSNIQAWQKHKPAVVVITIKWSPGICFDDLKSYLNNGQYTQYTDQTRMAVASIGWVAITIK